MARLAKRKVTEQIIQQQGNISAVARAFGVSRTSVYEFCKEKHPELWDMVNEAREMMKDDAESELYRQIRKGNTTALIFYLKTQAKDRGYIERTEQDNRGEVNVNVNYSRSEPLLSASEAETDTG